MARRFAFLLFAFLLLLAPPGAQGEESAALRQSVQPPTLKVYVDTRLYPVAKEAAAQMEREGWLFFSFVVDESPALLEKLVARPAAADVWLLEGPDLVKLLVGAKLAASDDVIELATDRLVWLLKEAKPDENPFALFNEKALSFVGLPDPENTQCGLHAVQALKRLGYGPRLAERLRPFPNAQTTLKALLEGTVKAALVYQSDLPKTGPLSAGVLLPRHAYLPIVYYGGPRPGGPLLSPARAFLVYLAAPERRALFQAQGFSGTKD